MNDALFRGALSVESPDRVPTRAEAASWIAARLTEPIGQTTLLAELGMSEGPTGTVVSAESRDVEQQGGTTSRVFFTIGESTLPMYGHGRVANGPADLLQWEGRDVTRSFVTDDPARPGERMFAFVQAAPEAESRAAEPGNGSGELTGRLGQRSGAETPSDEAGGSPYVLYGVAAAVIVLGIALFGRRRPKR